MKEWVCRSSPHHLVSSPSVSVEAEWGNKTETHSIIRTTGASVTCSDEEIKRLTYFCFNLSLRYSFHRGVELRERMERWVEVRRVRPEWSCTRIKCVTLRLHLYRHEWVDEIRENTAQMRSPKKTILTSNQHLPEQSEQKKKLDVITLRQAEFRLLLDIDKVNVNTHFCCFFNGHSRETERRCRTERGETCNTAVTFSVSDALRHF